MKSDPYNKDACRDLMDREASLLLSCVKAVISGDNAIAYPVDLSGFEWERIIEMAVDHRIIPVVQFFIRERRALGIPAGVRDYFSNAHAAVRLNNFFLTKELLAILALLKENHILAAPLKGPLLADMAYGNIGAREFTDIDILIREDDLLKVKELMSKAGYMAYNDPGISQAGFENEHEFYLRKGQQIIKLDIHWKIVEGYYGFECSSDQMLSRGAARIVLGQAILVLCPEDMMLSMIMHHGKEAWREIRYIADIGGLIMRQRDMDWDRIMIRSKEIGMEKGLLLGLYLTENLLCFDLPERLKQVRRYDPVTRKMGDKIMCRYFNVIAQYTPGDIKFDFALQQELNPRVDSYFFIKDSLDSLVRPNALDQSWVRLPRKLYFLYYFVRFFRLVKTYGIKRIFDSISKLLKAIWMTGFRKISRS